MPLMISISKGDLAKGIPLPIGWQKFIVKLPRAETSKDQKSINYCVDLYLENDPNERYITHRFNSQNLGFMGPYIAALTNKTVPQVLAEITSDKLNFDFESTGGMKLQGKVRLGEWQGRPKSEIDDFLPYDAQPKF